jgi:hypothetical protein
MATNPPLFLPIKACGYFGLSRTKLYSLAKRDPDIVIRLDGRSLIDVARLTELIAALPRGARKVGQ